MQALRIVADRANVMPRNAIFRFDFISMVFMSPFGWLATITVTNID
jgi:hypothetical protein